MSSRTLSKAATPTTMSPTSMSTPTSASSTSLTKVNPKTASSSLTSSSSSSIVALPSMSSHLFILPQAKHMDSLPVYPTSSAQRYAESEAKLKKALERNAAREDLTSLSTRTSTTTATSPPPPPPLSRPPAGQGHHHHLPPGHQQPHPYPPRTFIPQPIYSEPSSPISHSPPIMMRSRQKPTC